MDRLEAPRPDREMVKGLGAKQPLAARIQERHGLVGHAFGFLIGFVGQTRNTPLQGFFVNDDPQVLPK